jgi:transcriptional regulator with XRE-family HTH domain
MAKAAPKKSIYSPEYDRFLTLLRKAREDAGLTQAQAALKLKRPQSFLSKCESGERRVDVVELMQLCEAYQIPTTAFVRKLKGG